MVFQSNTISFQRLSCLPRVMGIFTCSQRNKILMRTQMFFSWKMTKSQYSWGISSHCQWQGIETQLVAIWIKLQNKILTHLKMSCTVSGNTEVEMTSFWWNIYHWLHQKLSKWQLLLQPMVKILSKWWHFYFSECLLRHSKKLGCHGW